MRLFCADGDVSFVRGDNERASCRRLGIKCSAALCAGEFSLFAIVSFGAGRDYNDRLTPPPDGQTDNRVIKASPTPFVRSFRSVPVGD